MFGAAGWLSVLQPGDLRGRGGGREDKRKREGKERRGEGEQFEWVCSGLKVLQSRTLGNLVMTRARLFLKNCDLSISFFSNRESRYFKVEMATSSKKEF